MRCLPLSCKECAGAQSLALTLDLLDQLIPHIILAQACIGGEGEQGGGRTCEGGGCCSSRQGWLWADYTSIKPQAQVMPMTSATVVTHIPEVPY